MATSSKKERSFAEYVSEIYRGNIMAVRSYTRRKPKGKRKVVHVKGYERRKRKIR